MSIMDDPRSFFFTETWIKIIWYTWKRIAALVLLVTFYVYVIFDVEILMIEKGKKLWNCTLSL